MTDQTKQNQIITFSTHITIKTLNINGLHDDEWRQKIFQILQNKKKTHNPSAGNTFQHKYC